MKISYAFRRSVFYPWHRDSTGWELPPRERRGQYLARLRALGFQGIELGANIPGTGGQQSEAARREAVVELRRELEDAGVPCVTIRGGGGVAAPRSAATGRQRLREGVQIAAWIGANLLNTTVGAPHAFAAGPGTGIGERISQGGSRTATADAYERTAEGLREVASFAADLGVEISIEVHQHSIVDNSWSALHLLDLIDRPNVGINPDLGNIYWTYDTPEETSEAAITALAPRAKYWHCKSLRRVHIPDLQRTIFVQVPLPDGEIDYRFALAAMANAGYKGYVAIEGLREGDHLYGDGRSAAYVRDILHELGAYEE